MTTVRPLTVTQARERGHAIDTDTPPIYCSALTLSLWMVELHVDALAEEKRRERTR